MKIGKKPPEQGPILIETDTRTRRFTWFDVRSTPIGDLRYTGRGSWVADDGTEYKTPSAALVQMEVARRSGARSIEPGDYHLRMDSVTQLEDRLIIRTPGGDVVIHRAAR